jgi:hypothetical protein
MERTEVLDMMGDLKLYGMRSAYDETLATAIKRKHEPQRFVGDLSMAPRFSSKVAPQNSPVWRVWAVSRVGDRRLRSLAAGHDG